MTTAPDSTAFPITEHMASGNSRTHFGMTIREYFAAHAPEQPQEWFTPYMPTSRPDVRSWLVFAKRHNIGAAELPIDDWGNIKEQFLQEDLREAAATFNKSRQEEQNKGALWDAQRDIQKQIQWPWAWADRVIAASAYDHK